jgi:predicted permease
MLVVAQVAASVALVATASLFVRTFENLAHLNAGFAQDHVLVADFDLSPLKLAAEELREYKREIFEQVRATAGVISAADTTIVPLSGNGWNDRIDIPGTAVQRKLAYFSEVSSDYFRTLAVPMLAGRDFNSADTPGGQPVAIVNEAFAKQFLGNGGAVGRYFGVRQDAGKPDKMYQIVGVAGNTKYMTLKEPYGPVAFLAGSQDAAPDSDFTMVIRSDEDLASLVASLKAVAVKNSPAITLNFSVLRNSIRAGLGRENLMATLSGFYGMLAAILAIIGIYGTMAYSVSRRTGEIGVRMALGATRGRILGMIVRDALTTLGIGLGIGTVLAMAAGRAVQTMLFGLKPDDPVSLGLALGGMAAAGLAASLIPAQRAAAVQPVETLREE